MNLEVEGKQCRTIGASKQHCSRSRWWGWGRTQEEKGGSKSRRRRRSEGGAASHWFSAGEGKPSAERRGLSTIFRNGNAVLDVDVWISLHFIIYCCRSPLLTVEHRKPLRAGSLAGR